MIKQKQIVTALRRMVVRIKPLFQLLLDSIAKAGARIKPFFGFLRACIAKAGAWAKKAFRLLYDSVVKTGVRKIAFILVLFGLLISAVWLKHLHTIYFGPNVVKNHLLFIHEGDKFDQVEKLLKDSSCLANVKTFRNLARFKDYDVKIRPGAYRLQAGWSNNQLINILKSGAQTPVTVTFNNVRTREDLAGKLAHQLQSDSAAFISAFRNDSSATRNGFKPETFPSLFIPNTYSFYWTITPEGFLARMKREYDLFWNEARRLKARTIGLTADQVATLASIVQEESNKNEDKPIIAGVYLNRLKKNWPLQADPTIRFALGDFTIRRILTAQLSVDSPYNTYKNAGLPPGPINIPEISSLEAVLNAVVHDYFYFCAKEDFSGYHNFAKTLSEHNRNAQKYQAALNKKKIFK